MSEDLNQTETERQNPLVVRCMNVKFSPNLGDGLLSECLEAALVKAGAHASTCSVDLAGRTAYGQVTPGRGTVLSVLDKLPAQARHLAVQLPLKIQSKRKWQPHYEKHLKQTDAMVIGGGNLLADLDLNFPTKLSLAADVAAKQKIKSVIFGCGMGSAWSRKGLSILERSFRGDRLLGVFLRDEASKAVWDSQLGRASGQEAIVVRDPGLMASRVYGPPSVPKGSKPRVGIGIMSHVALRYHASTTINAAALSSWYVELATSLKLAGFDVFAFTNGSPEDVAAAIALKPTLRTVADGGVDLVTPENPKNLAHLIAGCDAIVAYRMHAVIAAYSYGVPALALSWDKKLDSFMTSVDQSQMLHDPSMLSAEDASVLVQKVVSKGISKTEVAAVISEAEADVTRLYDCLT